MDYAPALGVETFKDVIYVTPNEVYEMRLEVLRNDLGDEGEEVKYIKIDGESIGRCKPPGDDQECDFYDCSSNLERKEFSSSSGILSVELTYTGHSHDCDCNKATWSCEKQNNDMKGRTRIAAAARITLHHKVVAKGTNLLIFNRLFAHHNFSQTLLFTVSFLHCINTCLFSL